MEYPRVAEIWDQRGIDYSILVGKICEYLKPKDSPKIFVPGVGKGRVIRDLLRSLRQNFELIVVEPDNKALEEFINDVINIINGNTINSTNIKIQEIRGKYGTIKVFKGSIEDYLTQSCSTDNFDLILCPLFFHYVTYGWVSILQRLYKLLNSDGLFIVDRICGTNEQTQLLLECIDCHPDKLESFELPEDCLKWRNYYLKRILQEGTYWGSVIKGTDIRLIIEALQPLFKKYESFYEGSHTFKLGDQHLPWWWGSREEETNVPFNESKELSLTFEFHIFKDKKEETVSNHWNLVRQACIQNSIRNMDAILWFLKNQEGLSYSFQDAEHFVLNILPSIAMQLGVSSGIINYECKVTSIFIATGSLPLGLQLPKLEKLFILINDSDGGGKNRIQTWLKNYVIYSDILKSPLSEAFIISGKRFVLLPEGSNDLENNSEVSSLEKFGYNPIRIPVRMELNTNNIELQYSEVKQLLWWKLLELDMSIGIGISGCNKGILQDFVKEVQSNVPQQGCIEAVLKNHNLNIESQNLFPLSPLMRDLGRILFLPVPTYFEFGKNDNFTVRSILGLGITVDSTLNYEELKNVENIYTLMSLLMRRLQDNYLALRWVRACQVSALRSAGAAILMESYAHNIGAHTLEGLKRYISEMWERFREGGVENESILRIRELLKDNLTSIMPDIIGSHSQLPEYITYLQGKSAFWNAISRSGSLFGGEIRNLWELIDGFAKNNLLCGSLGSSEGFDGIEFYIYYKGKKYCLGASDKWDIKIYRFEEEGINEKEDKRRELFQKRIDKEVCSDYFVCLNNLREELTKCPVFLPEGIVGQQAVYTIWENIIRNVKHCKKQESINNVPFNIDIGNEDEFYQITSWIDLESAEGSKDMDEAIKKMENWEGVLLGDKPNMGGTSQNILCAGMVLGLDFLEIERRQREGKQDKKVMEFEIKEIDGQKRIAWTLRLWKGKEYIDWAEINGRERAGLPGRYKIIKVSNDTQEEDFLANASSIRRVISSSGQKSLEFCNLYKGWVQQFILNPNKYPKGLVLWEGGWESKYKFSETVWKIKPEGVEGDTPYYQFYHRKPLEENSGVQDALLSEWIEVVATKIDIYDNRLFNCYQSMKEDQQCLLNELGVGVYNEQEGKLTNCDKNHFLVIHLSFIEKLSGGKQNEEAVKQFWCKYSEFVDNYEFLIVTTGRAREWITGLTKGIRMKVRYIPIENLERCFDEGRNLEPKSPAFGVKYALVKTIFGS